MAKPKLKTETLNLRVTTDTKNMLRTIAGMERRSLANMVEMLVLEHASRRGLGQLGAGVHQPDNSQSSP